MRIDFFEKITKNTGKSVNVYKALERIKDGTYKRGVENVRKATTKKEKTEQKAKLPYFTFGGTFEVRSIKGLKKASGLITLDIDGVEDLDEVIEQINKDKFTFCSFVSPSGNGLKVLVKIPTVDNDKDYKSFYLAAQKHFSQYADCDHTTDICRPCYVSYDPNLFLNVDSERFTDQYIEPIKEPQKVNIPLQDMSEVSRRIVTWFNKTWTTGENRNNNLFKLSIAFNDFGVPESEALSYCSQYVAPDFPQGEIDKLIRSAYKNKANFGTKQFENTKVTSKITRMVANGTDLEQLRDSFGDLEGLEEEFERANEKIDQSVFWYYDDKDKIHISNIRFDNYLQSKGICKYFPHKSSSEFDFIIKDDNFIDWIDTTRIKDIVKKELLKSGDYDVWDLMAKNTQYFKKDYLSMMETVQIEPKRDTYIESFIYYKNKVVKTTKDGIELLDYKDIDELVWKNQIIDRDIIINDESEGEFKTFIWRLSGEDPQRYKTLRSVIGYLMHSYQNPSKPKAIIFNDEMISEGEPNGGSGKGLIHKAIGHIKNICVEDGKKFDPRGQFAYQKVNKDTQIFLMDDVPKHFVFENLFSLVTEGMTVEKKGQDAFQIPFAESPKVSITTNYTVKGSGSSHRRRVFEVEIANHYNDNYTPEDEFKHQLFTEWTDEEWAFFDNYMIRCIQFYLQNGLVKSETINTEFKKYQASVSPEVIEFMESITWDGLPVRKKELFDRFNKEYHSKKMGSTTFYQRVKAFCDFNNYKFETKKSNGVHCFYIKNPNEKITEEVSEDGLPY